MKIVEILNFIRETKQIFLVLSDKEKGKMNNFCYFSINFSHFNTNEFYLLKHMKFVGIVVFATEKSHSFSWISIKQQSFREKCQKVSLNQLVDKSN